MLTKLIANLLAASLTLIAGLLTLAVLLVCPKLYAQRAVFWAQNVSSTPACGAIGTPCTDNFIGSGALNSPWQTSLSGWSAYATGAISRSSSFAVGSGAFDTSVAIYNGGSMASNQFSQVTLTALGAGVGAGLCVRCTTGGNGYVWGATASLVSCSAGSCTYLTSCSYTPAAGQVLKLGISGTTITCYVNGASVGSISDSTYSSGSPGIVIQNNSAGGTSGVELSTWSGGSQ